MSGTISTTKRSMDWLRDKGYRVAVVEQWLSFPERKNGIPTGKTIRIKRDAFNVCDIIAVHPDKQGTLYVQTTTRGNQAARRNKILLSADVPIILRAGNAVHVHGWAQAGERGKRKLWEVFVFEAKLEKGQIKFYPLLEEEAF